MIEQNRWKDISRLYHEARRQPADARKAFLRQACDGDEQLSIEVESLLASDADAGDFLASAAADELVATLGAETVSLLGRQVASYRIDALLGVGGMGEVYRATDTRLNRPVALKILPEHLHEVPHLRERFEREARAVAALRHPHICVLYDIGEDDGIAFLVMELLEGETLAERLTAGPLERDELFRCAIDISDALAETHRQGVVHGDLKPGNVMLTREGAKLLDFGLATMSPSATAAAVSIGEGRVAHTTTIGGTLAYMAPEQLEGRATDWRSDVFAFGAILYEMVTARRAFDGRTAPGAPMDSVVDQPVPPSPDAPRWARDLAPLIDRCLARNPDDRWARTLDVADELRRISISSNELPQQEPQLAERTLTRGWGRFVAVTVVSIASFWWAADRWNWPVGQPLSFSAVGTMAPLTLGNMRPLTADDRLEVDPTFSPDGRLIAYAAGTATGMRVFVRSVSEGPARQLTDTLDALEYHPRWSPDGREILYVTPTGAFVVAASGGPARRVDSQADTAGSYSATTPNTARRIFSSAIWSPDGRRLAIAYGGSLSIVPADGVGERRRIGSSPYELHSCDWSPDGRWIACISGNWSFAAPGGSFGNLSPSAVLLIPTAGGTPVEIMGRTAVHRSPVWSSDGRRLYFVSNQEGSSDIYSIEITDQGAARGTPVRATTGLGVYSIAFTPNRRALAYAAYSARANIWSVPISSTGPPDLSRGRAVTSGNQTIEAMRVTRDGRWLLYDSNLHGNFDIFRMAIDGGGAVERLTSDSGDEFAPDLSADGESLAYHSWRTGSRDIFVKSLRSSVVEQVTATASQESFPTWSPDGRAIAFLDQVVQGGTARGAFLVRKALSGSWGSPSHLRSGTSRLSWSPEGKFLAYAHRGTVETWSIDSNVPHVVFEPSSQRVDPAAESVQVSVDGLTLFFKSHDERGRASLWSVPAGGGRPTLVVRLDDPARPSSRTDFAVSADRLYFTVDDRRSNIWVTDVTGR